MSGKPSPEGVRIFRSAVARLAKSGERIDILRNEIAVRERELKSQVEEYSSARKSMFECRERMDVASNGNNGHEGRFEWFIRELYKQLTEPPTLPLIIDGPLTGKVTVGPTIPSITFRQKDPTLPGPVWHNTECTCVDCRPQ